LTPTFVCFANHRIFSDNTQQKEEETHLAVANQGDLFLKYHPENRKLLENPEGIWEDATAVAATSIPDKSSFAFCVAGAASGCTNRQRFDYLFSSWGSSGLSETPEMKAWAAANGKYMGLWSDLVKLNGNIKTRRWTEEILAHEPLTLDERAVKFVDGVVASDLPPKSKRARAGKDAAETPFTAGKIYSLVLPIDENTKFRLSRDCERKFTNDGRVLIFEVIGADNINRQAGVLDPASRQLRVRWPCPLKWDPAEGKGTRNDDSKAESLERAAVNMFTEMGVDPREFFNSMGQKHGMCMICGRPLTAAQSKKKGYGADCAKHVGWQYD